MLLALALIASWLSIPLWLEAFNGYLVVFPFPWMYSAGSKQ